MTLSQFNCPHCRGPFQVDTSLPALQVACPHCRQPVALLSEPPLSQHAEVVKKLGQAPRSDANSLQNTDIRSEPVPFFHSRSVPEPPLIEPPPADPPITEVATGRPFGYSLADLLPPIAVVSAKEAPPQPSEKYEAIGDELRSRLSVADDRAARKFVKNMIVWVCCAIVLVSILAFFLRQGGS